MKNIGIKSYSAHNIAKFVCASFLAILLLATSLLTLSSCAVGGGNDESYVKISSGGKTLSVEIPVAEGSYDEVWLFAIDVWQGMDDLKDATRIAEAKVRGKTAKAEIDINGQLHETLCKGYFFAEKTNDETYSAITGVYYVSNPRDVAKKIKTDEDELYALRKGALGGADELAGASASATVLTVELGDLMLPTRARGSIPYVWNGLTYYADRDAVEELDGKIAAYAKSGIKVYLELVQTKSASELPLGVSDIVFDAPAGKSGYALNMTTREGASRVCGIFDFLSERYGESGFCDSFIIGRNVNLFSEYYVGGPDSEAAIKNYLHAVRSAYNILLSHTPHGNIYLAVSNNWNVASDGNYSVRDIISAFNNLAGAEGDFFWQVSIEANASDASDSSIWNDPLVTDRSEFISPANIETLSNHLASRAYTCRGMQRHILINRLAIGGNNAEEQAASYAYAYYKSLNTESVDAIIYGVLVDDGVLNNGIYAIDETGEPTEKKLTEVFLGIDGKKSVDLGFVDDYVKDWKYLYKNNSKDALRVVSVGGKTVKGHSREEIFALTGMSGGDMLGFVPSVEGSYAELRYSYALERPSLYIGVDREKTIGALGTVSDVISVDSLGEGELLEIFAMMSATGSTGNTGSTGIMTVRLSGFGKSGTEYVYSAKTEINANEWNYHYFDVSELLRNVDGETVSLSITVEPTDPNAEISGLWISEINTVSDKGISFGWLFILIGVLAALGGITVFVLWFKKNFVFVKE